MAEQCSRDEIEIMDGSLDFWEMNMRSTERNELEEITSWMGRILIASQTMFNASDV
jgi:hypothetical protein